MDKKAEVIAVAQRLMAQRGFAGFSYRDVAEEVGITTASIHYHFPSKTDLGEEAAHNYTETFMAQLGEPDDSDVTPAELLKRFVNLYSHTGLDGDGYCLCGTLSSTTDALPKSIRKLTRGFFEKQIEWLTQVLQRQKPYADQEEIEVRAWHLLALAQGLLMISRPKQNPKDHERLFTILESAIAD